MENPPLIAQVRDILERCLAENTHAWTLGAEGEWMRRPTEGDKRWAQTELMERAVRMSQASTGRPL